MLRKLEQKIDESTMQKMNAKVDNDGMMAEAVAEDFLQKSGLID